MKDMGTQRISTNYYCDIGLFLIRGEKILHESFRIRVIIDRVGDKGMETIIVLYLQVQGR